MGYVMGYVMGWHALTARVFISATAVSGGGVHAQMWWMGDALTLACRKAGVRFDHRPLRFPPSPPLSVRRRRPPCSSNTIRSWGRPTRYGQAGGRGRGRGGPDTHDRQEGRGYAAGAALPGVDREGGVKDVCSLPAASCKP